MANVDPNAVIRKLAERIADEAINRALTEVALADSQAQVEALKVQIASTPVADGQ